MSEPMPAAATLDAMRRALAALSPLRLAIRDDSALHAGHAGARDGGGHYHVEIVSAAFDGQRAVLRHRQVYAALGSLMGARIHALAIDARSPAEDALVQPRQPSPT